MSTECNSLSLDSSLKQREIRGSLTAGAITSDAVSDAAGVEKRIGILHQFACLLQRLSECGSDRATVQELVAQRVYGLALGYEI